MKESAKGRFFEKNLGTKNITKKNQKKPLRTNWQFWYFPLWRWQPAYVNSRRTLPGWRILPPHCGSLSVVELKLWGGLNSGGPWRGGIKPVAPCQGGLNSGGTCQGEDPHRGDHQGGDYLQGDPKEKTIDWEYPTRRPAFRKTALYILHNSS